MLFVAFSGRLSDSLVFELVQEKLNSKLCRNQGFVLEGFPKTYEQAKQIFRGEFRDPSKRSVTPSVTNICASLFSSVDEEVEEDEYSLKKPVCNIKITPGNSS